MKGTDGMNWITSEKLREDATAATPETGLRKYFTAEKLEETGASRQLRFVISTADVDRDNDTIDPMGWDLKNYIQNPVVLWAHSHKDLPVAKAVSVGMEGNSLVAVAEFDTHPFAETVFRMLKGGFLRAVSVGFRATEYMINEERRGIDFKRQELLEFSVCPVPANPMALVSASADKDIDLEQMRKWMQDMIEQWPGELKLKGAAWEKLRLAAPAPAVQVQQDKALADVQSQLADIKTSLAALATTKTKKDDEADALPAAVAPPVANESAPAPEPAQAQAEAAKADESVQAPAEASASDEPVLDISDDDATASEELTLDVADPVADVASEAGMTEAEFRECMGDVLRDALVAEIRGAVTSAIRQSQGRLD